MNKKFFKRIIACVLSAVLVFGVSVTAFAAQGSTIDSPIIVINGIDGNPLLTDPNTSNATVIWPPKDSEISFLIGEGLTIGITQMASGNYNELMNFFVGSQVYEKMDAIQLNPDGTSRGGNIGPQVWNQSLAYYLNNPYYDTIAGSIGKALAEHKDSSGKYDVGANNVYVFTYDWRLNPVDTAAKLDEFIQTVKTNSHKESVSIISEGYGSSIATSYLNVCYENATADVDNFVTVNSAFEGTSLIGDLFTGHLVSQLNNVVNYTSAFIRYTNDYSDNPLTWLSTWITNYVLNKNWETQNLSADIITVMGHIIDPLYDNYLRDMLKNFTGLWALVPVEYYDDAMDFMFTDEEGNSTYNSELEEQIQQYKNYQNSAATFLNKAKSEGINISVVSSWDLQLLPIGDDKQATKINGEDTELYGLSAQSDGLIDTYYSSFGAYCIALNDVGAAIQHKQENKDGECSNHTHVSATYDSLNPEYSLGGIAHYIDASTCALPDNTWFIQNMKHGTFQSGSNSIDFLIYLLTAEKTTSVFSAGQYPQFMYYNRYVSPGYLRVPNIDSLPNDYMLGDVNLDGVVNAADARAALRISSRLDVYPDVKSTTFLNADVNGDGVITAADARIILRVSAGLNSFQDFQNTSDVDK